MNKIEEIFVSNKPPEKYVTAFLFAKSKGKDEIHIIGRGNNVKRCIDVVSILLRDYLKLENKDDCEIIIGSEPFENRYVSTILIKLRGLESGVTS